MISLHDIMRIGPTSEMLGKYLDVKDKLNLSLVNKECNNISDEYPVYDHFEDELNTVKYFYLQKKKEEKEEKRREDAKKEKKRCIDKAKAIRERDKKSRIEAERYRKRVARREHLSNMYSERINEQYGNGYSNYMNYTTDDVSAYRI